MMYYAKNMNWLPLEKRIFEFVIGVLLMSCYYYDIVERGQRYVSIITSRNEID
jgi:hypothetical protein